MFQVNQKPQIQNQFYHFGQDQQTNKGHLLLQDRKCRTCSEIKNLVDGFYRTRKDRGPVASSYSYECKECTIKRILATKKSDNRWEYPDW